MRFNIAIPTFQRQTLLERTLDSLTNCSRPEGFEYIYVIEDGSNDGTKEVCNNFSKKLPIIYIHQSQAGKGQALQHVIELLKNGFLLFLDDDVRVCSDHLISYSVAINQHGPGYIYGGPLLIDYEDEPKEWLKKYLPRSVVGWSPTSEEYPKLKTKTFMGPNYGMFVQDIIDEGGFLTTIGPGSHIAGTEGNPTGLEREIQVRMLNNGKKTIYIENAKVWHYVPRNRCTPGWMLHRIYRNNIKYRFLQEKKFPTKAKCIFGAPVKLWIKYIFRMITTIFTSFVPDEHFRFKMKYKVYILRGQIKGFKLSRQ